MKSTAIETLQQAGIRPSVQRVAILQYLLEHFTHPTVDEIYAFLSPQMPTLSKTTVYNTLKLLSDAGLALCLNLDERNQRFDGTLCPHAHFICTQCGTIADVPLPANSEQLRLPAGPKGINIKKVEISYYGLCDACGQKNEQQQTL